MTEELDAVTRELVGIAAAIAGHCRPCFSYHYKEARNLGIAENQIRAAIELAQAIRSSGDEHMDEFAARAMATRS